jgi:hypothetical protein
MLDFVPHWFLLHPAVIEDPILFSIAFQTRDRYKNPGINKAGMLIAQDSF